MARNLSDAFRQAMQSQSSDVAALMLLTVEHVSLPAPIRLVLNTEDVVSRGETYTRMAFSVTLPDQVQGQPPRALLQVDAVDRQIVASLVDESEAPTVRFELVSSDTPDTVEYQTTRMEWRQVQWNGLTMEGELTGPAVLNRRTGFYRFTPTVAPGLFRGGL